MCKLCKLLYRLIPGKQFQYILIKKHIANCTQCQKEIEEASSLIRESSIPPNWIEATEDLWPQIRQVICSREKMAEEHKRKFGISLQGRWRWSMAFVFLALMIGLAVLMHKNFLTRTSIEEKYITKNKPRITIKYAEIKGKKAKPSIYQTPNASFIWFDINEWEELK
jgi:hypothetical protein